MIKKQILEDLKTAVKDLGFPATDIVLSIPKNSTFGDYTTNLALQLSKLDSVKNKQSAHDIANDILEKFGKPDYLDKVEIAGAGFINFFIADGQLLKNIDAQILPKGALGKIFIEYGHVNPLKEIHVGHLRTFILGESLSRVFEALGATVFRANYQGDIGLHIAKAIWGIKQLGLPTRQLTGSERAEFLGKAYAQGNKSYEDNEASKVEIDQINVALYKKDPQYQEIYELTRDWSLSYFEPAYELLGIKYDRCFFESEVYQLGQKIVLENLGKVFERNQGAVIFNGEKLGLQTRVFITSAGNPTYEGKEIGLAQMEYDSFNYDKSIHVVASEQEGYFQVVIAAINSIFPYLKDKKYHLSYGLVDLKEGKMSSRTGNVVTIDDLYHVVCERVREISKTNSLEIDQDTVRKVAMAAIKFAYLKYSPSQNMIFDLDQSVSLAGDSGPYIQYTYARIQSVLKKAPKSALELVDLSLEKQERELLRQLLYFPEIVEEVATTLHPNLLASYLVELAKLYNLFYQQSRIIGSEKVAFRLQLSQDVASVLQKGLYLLGIEVPERM